MKTKLTKYLEQARFYYTGVTSDETTKLYFIATKKLVNLIYPDAEKTYIRITFPKNNIVGEYGSVEFSPVVSKLGFSKLRQIKLLHAYDWFPVHIPFNDVCKLISIYNDYMLKSHVD